MGPRRPHQPSAHVARYLARNERVVIEMKQHWARILPPVFACLLGFVLVVAAGLMAPAWMGSIANAAWWIWLVLVGVLIYRIIEWWDETFVITNKRLILVHGLIVKKVAMMPLSKVTDMSYNRSLPARLLGYGTFVMESAGQVQALNVVNYVRDPSERYRELCALIFGTDDDDDPAGHRGDHIANAEPDDEVWRENWDADDPWQDEPDEGEDGGWWGEPAAGGASRPRSYEGRRTAGDDDTDPYGFVSKAHRTFKSDPDHVYSGRDEVHGGSGGPDSDGESVHPDAAWSVSREHATRPQVVDASRNVNKPITWRDAE